MVHISYILVVSISGLSPIQKIHGGDWMRRETIPPESPSDTRVLYRVPLQYSGRVFMQSYSHTQSSSQYSLGQTPYAPQPVFEIEYISRYP